jgi:hypothetical protein
VVSDMSFPMISVSPVLLVVPPVLILGDVPPVLKIMSEFPPPLKPQDVIFLRPLNPMVLPSMVSPIPSPPTAPPTVLICPVRLLVVPPVTPVSVFPRTTVLVVPPVVPPVLSMLVLPLESVPSVLMVTT